MSSLNPIENGLTSDEDQEAPETLSNPSPPPSETIERVEDILERVENYNSVIPDSVTQNILESSGLNNTSPEVTRLISLAAQKFISDISYEALQHCKMRGGGRDHKSKNSGRDRKYAMTNEDIIVALSDQGVAIKKPPYYAN